MKFKLSRKDWEFEQGADEVVGRVLQLLVTGRGYKIQKEDSRDFKILWKLKKQLSLKDGLLYRRGIFQKTGECSFSVCDATEV